MHQTVARRCFGPLLWAAAGLLSGCPHAASTSGNNAIEVLVFFSGASFASGDERANVRFVLYRDGTSLFSRPEGGRRRDFHRVVLEPHEKARLLSDLKESGAYSSRRYDLGGQGSDAPYCVLAVAEGDRYHVTVVQGPQFLGMLQTPVLAADKRVRNILPAGLIGQIDTLLSYSHPRQTIWVAESLSVRMLEMKRPPKVNCAWPAELKDLHDADVRLVRHNTGPRAPPAALQREMRFLLSQPGWLAFVSRLEACDAAFLWEGRYWLATGVPEIPLVGNLLASPQLEFPR